MADNILDVFTWIQTVHSQNWLIRFHDFNNFVYLTSSCSIFISINRSLFFALKAFCKYLTSLQLLYQAKRMQTLSGYLFISLACKDFTIFILSMLNWFLKRKSCDRCNITMLFDCSHFFALHSNIFAALKFLSDVWANKLVLYICETGNWRKIVIADSNCFLFFYFPCSLLFLFFSICFFYLYLNFSCSIRLSLSLFVCPCYLPRQPPSIRPEMNNFREWNCWFRSLGKFITNKLDHFLWHSTIQRNETLSAH